MGQRRRLIEGDIMQINRNGAKIGALARELALWPVSAARVVDEAECLLAVLLAIALSHMLGVSNVGWATFSAYLVIRTSFAETLRRGSLRIVGTILGVSLAWVLAPQLPPSPIWLSVALALVGAITLYLALLEHSGYGWMFTGLSFALVLIDSMEYGSQQLDTFVQLRLLEVCLGTGAALLVSGVSALTIRPRLPTLVPASAPHSVRFCHPAALRHALKGAIALAVIPWLWDAVHFKALSQSSVTIMAVMMVPMADLVAANNQAATRLRHRFLGAGLGGLLATAVLMLSHGSPLIMTIGAGAGVVIGRRIENGKLNISYAGAQFSLAFLVVLVPDNYTGLSVQPGLERMFGILLGMALLEPLRMLFSLTKRGTCTKAC
jgi:uncharacterized membrane protein YccC